MGTILLFLMVFEGTRSL